MLGQLVIHASCMLYALRLARSFMGDAELKEVEYYSHGMYSHSMYSSFMGDAELKEVLELQRQA